MPYLIVFVLDDPDRCQAAVSKNYEIARRHFSYEVLANALKQLLNT